MLMRDYKLFRFRVKASGERMQTVDEVSGARRMMPYSHDDVLTIVARSSSVAEAVLRERFNYQNANHAAFSVELLGSEDAPILAIEHHG